MSEGEQGVNLEDFTTRMILEAATQAMAEQNNGSSPAAAGGETHNTPAQDLMDQLVQTGQDRTNSPTGTGV